MIGVFYLHVRGTKMRPWAAAVLGAVVARRCSDRAGRWLPRATPPPRPLRASEWPTSPSFWQTVGIKTVEELQANMEQGAGGEFGTTSLQSHFLHDRHGISSID